MKLLRNLLWVLGVAGCSSTGSPFSNTVDGGTQDVTMADLTAVDVMQVDITATDVAFDGPVTCTPASGCPADEICTPQSCSLPWICESAHSCPAGMGEFCACDGTTTFIDDTHCLHQPYSHVGACGQTVGDASVTPPTDAGDYIFCVLSSGWYCPAGGMCPRGDGCNTCMCSPDGILECSANDCPVGPPYPPQCVSNFQCQPGETCPGTVGCATTAPTCQGNDGGTCDETLVPYCLCSGATVYGSRTCPPGVYVSTGPCGSM